SITRDPLCVVMIGLIVATGPVEIVEPLRYLPLHATVPVSVIPNAGLPELGANGAVYPLGAEEFAPQVADFVSEFGLSMVGGCCGTTPEHVTRLREQVRGREKADREPTPINAVSSLYSSTPLREDAGIIMMGGCTHANGSQRI